ncbi:hypothetical protein BCR39DRAFT_48672 [Naematelia encephala]|uniref:Uncharacterized protein n=1 Tax=Naematelia encephala TaxID=71784 RepID=A0A1Y2AHA0_9TREE|nr:hypothetical protein BCR39DRAFT_48672 [Naematelia encephala]
MPPTEAIRKVYGVQTLGAIWKLVVMEAQFDGVDEAAISGGMASDENGHIDLSPHLFVVTTLWTGDLLDPQALLELVIILRDVRDEQIVRHELIGNWLYCLRDQDAPPARSRRRKPIATGSDSARAIKKSRNERGTDGGRIGPPGGDQSDSGLGLKSVGSTVADKLSRPSLHLDSIRNIMPLRDSTSYVVDWLSEQDSSSPQSSSGDFIEDTALPSKPPAPAAIVG